MKERRRPWRPTDRAARAAMPLHTRVAAQLFLAVAGACATTLSADGLEVRSVRGGKGVVATRAFAAGDHLYTIQRATLFRAVYPDMDTFETAVRAGDARDLLEHSVPGESGRVYCFSADNLPCFENHSDKPNVNGMHYSWLDGSEPSLEKCALRDIAADEEVMVDYNYCSGYDVRTDEAMHRFLALCEEFGVCKRPSGFRLST